MKTSFLRERRLASGLTQAELAARAGVSRQLVAAVEAGRNAPAVDAALALAHTLATTVEDLFADRPVEIIAALNAPLRNGASLRVGHVGDCLVAAELPDRGIAGATWAAPDAVVRDGAVRLFPGARPAGTVIAGCDPAVGVAEAMLGGLGPRSLLAISAPTGRALRALERGTIHAAIVHGPPRGLPTPAVPVVRRHLARWQVGLAVAPQLRGHSFPAVLGAGTVVVRRESEAASQQAFVRACAGAGIDPLPPGPRAAGHLDGARIAAAIGGAAVTTEGAAKSFDLGFIALEAHIVEVWVAQRWVEHPGIEAFQELLETPAFTERVAHLGGYDLSECGRRVDAG